MTTGFLHLPLKAEYFDAIADGSKPKEYRLRTPYWRKRLEGRDYDGIRLTKGYPRTGDRSRHMQRAWRGYEVETITHPHFGPEPIEVYAIDVSHDYWRSGSAPSTRNDKVS